MSRLGTVPARKAPAGRPSAFIRLGSANMLQAKRMATGCLTPGADSRSGRAVNLGLRFDESAFVRINHLEPIQRFAVAAGQSAADMVEGKAEFVTLDAHRFEGRAGINQILLAVGLGQSPQGQTAADLLFVSGMNVLEVADVVDDDHAGVGDGLRGASALPRTPRSPPACAP